MQRRRRVGGRSARVLDHPVVEGAGASGRGLLSASDTRRSSSEGKEFAL